MLQEGRGRFTGAAHGLSRQVAGKARHRASPKRKQEPHYGTIPDDALLSMVIVLDAASAQAIGRSALMGTRSGMREAPRINSYPL